MRILLPWAVSMLCLATAPSFAQTADPPPADDYIAGAGHAASFYGPEHGLEITGLDGNVAWEQVSDTDLFVFIRYHFTIEK